LRRFVDTGAGLFEIVARLVIEHLDTQLFDDAQRGSMDRFEPVLAESRLAKKRIL
jgi:hypothetical protein